jgi:predicted RNA-binding Zn ribbon-like protein
MQFNTYTAAGAYIAVWLVNHPSAEASALAAVLDYYDVHQPVTTADQVRVLRPWAGRLGQIFDATTVAEKAERADALLVAADCRPRLVSHGDGLPFHFHYASVRTCLAARVKALTAAGVAHVIDGGGGSRLRACSRSGCGVVFLDTSRNGRRHFCSVRCANQVNVANHRVRRRRASSNDDGHLARGPS